MTDQNSARMPVTLPLLDQTMEVINLLILKKKLLLLLSWCIEKNYRKIDCLLLECSGRSEDMIKAIRQVQ